jgi:hypothetical protein
MTRRHRAGLMNTLSTLPGGTPSGAGPEDLGERRRKHGKTVPHVVDFEQVILGVPEYDIAQSLVTSDALEDSDRAKFLAGYGAPGVSAELIDALIVFHVLQGWVYTARAELRDIDLWAARVRRVLNLNDVARPQGAAGRESEAT